MSESPEVMLGDLIHVKHGFAFKGEHFSASGTDLVLTPGNFKIGGGLQLRPGKEKYYAASYPKDFRLRPGDLLVVMTDLKQEAPILGSPAVIPRDGTYLHNQRLGLVTVKDPCRLNERFLYWLLVADRTRAQLRATATGATVRHTAPERIYKAFVPLPSLADQEAIAAVLDAIDDLIENNQQRIALLERIAQAIYREWFVHFRYPGHEDDELVDSPLGLIPAESEIKHLSEIARITMGQSPSSEHYNSDGDGKPFHQGVTHFGRHYPKHRQYCRIDGRLAEAGDHLVSVRAPVGRINRADVDLVIGRGLSALASRRDAQSLLGRQLKEVFSAEDAMGGGTIFKAITKGDLENVEVVQPSPRVAALAELIFAKHDLLIQKLTFSARVLERVRDLLLPRLVTGVVDVSDIDLDAFLEEPAA